MNSKASSLSRSLIRPWVSRCVFGQSRILSHQGPIPQYFKEIFPVVETVMTGRWRGGGGCVSLEPGSPVALRISAQPHLPHLKVTGSEASIAEKSLCWSFARVLHPDTETRQRLRGDEV